MKRRDALSCVGLVCTPSIAGCLAQNGNSNPESGGENGDHKGNDQEIRTPVLSTTEVGDPGSSFELDVEVTEQFTEEHPAELMIEFKNTGTKDWEFRMNGPYDNPFLERELTSETEENSLVLPQPEDNVIELDDSENKVCWRASDRVIPPDSILIRVLEEGESITDTLAVINAYSDAEEATSCMPAGVYDAQQIITGCPINVVDNDSEENECVEEEIDINLQFSIELEYN